MHSCVHHFLLLVSRLQIHEPSLLHTDVVSEILILKPNQKDLEAIEAVEALRFAKTIAGADLAKPNPCLWSVPLQSVPPVSYQAG